MKIRRMFKRLGPPAACLLLAVAAHAQVANITTATTAIYGWLKAVGAGVLTIGIGGVGFSMTVSHDKEAVKKFIWVAVGGVIICLAPYISNLIVSLNPN